MTAPPEANDEPGTVHASSDAAALPTPLPSWRDTPTRQAILSFVDSVTDPASPDYVAPDARLAVFDHDGTLWCEKPNLVHLYAIRDRYRELVRTQPRRLTGRLWRALRTNDDTLFDSYNRWGDWVEPLADALGVPFSDMDEAAYRDWMQGWLNRWRHPRFDVPVAGLVYRPMVELVQLLHEHDFRVAIATADEAAFVQLVSRPFYGVPPELVLGSSFTAGQPAADEKTAVRRGYHPDSFGDGDNKRINVAAGLLQQPILVAGNSDGDVPLLEWVASAPGRTLPLLVAHTDAEREYAYTGRSRSALEAARTNGWVIADMARDWETVFPTATSEQ
ncbi:MAG: HAD family hydrolase [Chloroflexota bacterium]